MRDIDHRDDDLPPLHHARLIQVLLQPDGGDVPAGKHDRPSSAADPGEAGAAGLGDHSDILGRFDRAGHVVEVRDDLSGPVRVVGTGYPDGVAPDPGVEATVVEPVKAGTLRSALIVSEVALSLMLLAGAGLLINSFWRVLQTEAGFDPKGVLALDIPLSRTTYTKPEQRSAALEATC